jgi:four helix bundle protein
MNVEELEVYQLSMKVADNIWDITSKRNYFCKDTIGKQIVRAADSISANLSEGFGRYHFKENKNFCYYSRGSLYETKTWIAKAHNRALISNENYDFLNKELNKISIKLNNYIKTIGKTKATP